MAQTSGFWTTTSAGAVGHQVASYTQLDWSLALEILAGCSGREGVAHEHLNEFLATVTAANTVGVQSGHAVVDGKWYENTATESINIPSAIGAGNTRIDRIVLRADWAGFKVELYRVAGTNAVTPTAPALTQISGVAYEIPLWQALVDTAGAVTLTDERQYATWDKPEPIYIRAITRNTEWAVEDDVDGFYIPEDFDGKIIKSVHIACHTPSLSGKPTVQIHNETQGWDVLSTRATIDVGEDTSYTAAVQPVVDTDYHEVSTGDFIRIDVDVAGTGAKGLDVIIVLEDD